jgi:hypothetical protein
LAHIHKELLSFGNERAICTVLQLIATFLVRFQLLFWNPFTSEQELEDQDWYREIATYGLDSGIQNRDELSALDIVYCCLVFRIRILIW